MLDRAIRIAITRRTVTAIIVPGDVQELARRYSLDEVAAEFGVDLDALADDD